MIVARVMRYVLLLATRFAFFIRLYYKFRTCSPQFIIRVVYYMNDVFDMIIYNVDDIKVGCSELCLIHCSIAAVTKLFVNNT